MDPYRVLEVDRHASQRDIKRAYRRLAFRYHPDQNPDDPEAEERFKEVVSAYEILSNRTKRASYDAQTREPPRSEPTETRPPPRPDPYVEHVLRRDVNASATFDYRDAYLGALASVALALASKMGEATMPFSVALGGAVLGGVVLSWPLARIADAIPYRFPRDSLRLIALLATALGAVIGASLMTQETPAFFRNAGLPYAFLGGMGGALIGGAGGRAFSASLGPVSGAAVGCVTGAFAAALMGFAFWYWGSVFRYFEYPPRDDLSVLAFAGVVCAFLGASVAAAIGGSR